MDSADVFARQKDVDIMLCNVHFGHRIGHLDVFLWPSLCQENKGRSTHHPRYVRESPAEKEKAEHLPSLNRPVVVLLLMLQFDTVVGVVMKI